MGRKRSTSGGAYKEMIGKMQDSNIINNNNDNKDDSSEMFPKQAQALMSALLQHHVQCHQTSVLHSLCCSNGADPSKSHDYTYYNTAANQLVMAAALIERCYEMDSLTRKQQQQQNNSNTIATSTSMSATTTTPVNRNNNSSSNISSLLTCRQLLLQKDVESGYTPLHWAIYQGSLLMILLLLSVATCLDDEQADNTASCGIISSSDNNNNNTSSSSSSPRLLSSQQTALLGTQRPMTLLHSAAIASAAKNDHLTTTCSKKHATTVSSSASSSLLAQMMTATDAEGLTPIQLLELQQRSELRACRWSLYRPTIYFSTRGSSSSKSGACNATTGRPQRSSSFDFTTTTTTTTTTLPIYDEQNEFDLLSQGMQWLQQREQRNRQEEQLEAEEEEESELLRQQQQQQQYASTAATTSFGCEVLTFGRAHHCALGVVASTSDHHHSTSHTESQTFRPQRVQAFAQDTVGRSGGAVAVAGATYHTLVVTKAGHVYAFGLGKGGRLGTGNELPCSLPTRIRGSLSSRFVVAVAAAENHSLCVTKCGDVYSWGSNRFGQLGWSNSGIGSRRGDGGGGGGSMDDTSPSRCCTPRRVDDLKAVHCVAVAAGEKHSVALSKLGEVYVWGDNTSGQLGISRRSGMHKVQRVELLWNSSSQHRPCIAIAASEQMTMALAVSSGRHQRRHVNSIYVWGHGSHVPSRVQFEACTESRNRPINPTAIACARYHNVAITSDGHVYTWGLHSDALGTKKSSTSKSTAAFSTPQLVTGMLPKNSGGLAVAVAASENHTAVVTDTGALFTWGATFGKNILGHEGVRWQPMPKRVPGVQRAVAVSAAKEHTILLVGASFPVLPKLSCNTSLENLAAHQSAKHVDLFNVLPVAILGDRFGNSFLKMYCHEFIQRNLDGVMNVCQKSVIRTLLSEQLATGALYVDKERDGVFHPLLLDLVLPSSAASKSLRLDTIAASKEWMQACTMTAQTSQAFALMDKYRETDRNTFLIESESSSRVRSQSISEEGTSSSRCLELTTNMDLGTEELAQCKLSCLSKEVRAVKKRLSQIAKLQHGVSEGTVLSAEEKQKVSRKPQLEADLKIFEDGVEKVRRRLAELHLLETRTTPEPKKGLSHNIIKVNEKSGSTEKSRTFRCDLCRVNCSDETTYELHMNGRKHRNKLAQVADEEQKQAAELLMAEQQRHDMKRDALPSPQAQRTSPWSKKSPKAQPKFNLPPPPVPVPLSIVGPSLPARSAKPSLAEIMAEESRKSANAKSTKSSKLVSPVGSAASPLAPVRKSALSHSSAASIAGFTPSGYAPVQMKSTPWASAPVYTVPSTPAVASVSNKGSLSLGDFITLPKSKPTASPLPGSWGCQMAAFQPCASPAVSFAKIQQQEKEFKAKEDQTFGSNGKWFIERRERAGSFREIEEEAAKEREYQLLVEEQLMIEKQIQEDIRQRQKKPPPKRECSGKKLKERENENKAIGKKEPGGSNSKQHKTRYQK